MRWIMFRFGLLLTILLPLSLLGQQPLGPASWSQSGLTQIPRADSLQTLLRLGNAIRYVGVPRFVDTTRNRWQYQEPAAIRGIANALANSRNRKVRVLHIGDSHLQADYYPGAIRAVLQPVFGYGGRGTVFPYAIAGTHSAFDYYTYAHGSWAWARNVDNTPALPLGIHGASAYTNDRTAGFRLRFVDSSTVWNNTRLRIWHKPGPASYDLLIVADEQPAVLAPGMGTSIPFTEVDLPAQPRNLTFQLTDAGDSTRKYFELYGLSLETPGDSGIVWHSVGINGANFNSILRQSEMPAQIEAMQPDLIVLDISGNEYYLGGLDAIDFELKLRSVVAILKRAAPQASLLISCSQDIWRGNRRIAATGPAASIARRVAFRTGSLFYDWYSVAGGPGSMLAWREADLAKRDRVHLTNTGYQLKGLLFANALLTSVQYALAGSSPWADSLAPDAAPPATIAEASLLDVNAAPAARPQVATGSVSMPAGGKRYHVVRSGETLGHIARKYRVSTTRLRQWNRLRGNIIRKGQRLVVSAAGAPVRVNPAPVTPSAKTAATTAAKYHTVRSGDTLWTIARRYGVETDRLKSLNRLSGDGIRVGQRLRVR